MSKPPRRRKPAKAPQADEQFAPNFDEKVRHAFERNGINTILLDIRQGQAQMQQQIADLQRRDTDARENRRIMHEKLDRLGHSSAVTQEQVRRIVPLVDAHEARHQQRLGEQRLIARASGYITRGKVIIGATLAGAGAIAGWVIERWPFGTP